MNEIIFYFWFHTVYFVHISTMFFCVSYDSNPDNSELYNYFPLTLFSIDRSDDWLSMATPLGYLFSFQTLVGTHRKSGIMLIMIMHSYFSFNTLV